jgi:hypothetical protein
MGLNTNGGFIAESVEVFETGAVSAWKLVHIIYVTD